MSGPAFTATVRQGGAPAPAMTVTVTKKGNIGQGRLFSVYRGTSCALDLKKETEIAKEIASVWDRAKALVIHQCPDASNLEINYSQLYISYADAAGVEHKLGKEEISAKNPEIRTLMEKVRTAGKRLYFQRCPAEFDNDCNRSLIGEKPFEIRSQKWNSWQPRTLNQFMNPDHFGKLQGDLLTDPARKAAIKQVIATEGFIQKFQGEVRDLKAKKEAEQQHPDFQKLPKAKRDAIQKDLSDLTQLEEKFNELDRYPLLWAVGMWGDTDIATANLETRLEKAGQISNGIQRVLSEDLKPGKDTRNIFKKLYHKVSGNPEGENLRGLKPFVKTYADEAGDLVLHDRLEAIGRLGIDRDLKAASVEELVAHNMLHLGQAGFDSAKALDSLGVKMDAALHRDLAAAMDNARGEAAKVLTTANGILTATATTSWEEQVDELRQDAVLKPLIGEKSK